jgi:hypothetical protein
MKLTKHIGRHANDKAIILYRKVPMEEREGVKTYEDHMCYILLSDKLPRAYHDAVMKLLESPEGQAANEFSDVLFRNLLPDGRNILQTLFNEKHVRKVQTIQVITTPTPTNNLRLDLLNEMLDKINSGGEAAKKLAEFDSAQGMSTKGKSAQAKEKARLAEKNAQVPVDSFSAGADGVLSDADIAKNLLAQSARLESQATGMLEESKRLAAEAASLLPSKAPKTTTVKKTAKKTVSAATTKKTAKKAQKVA